MLRFRLSRSRRQSNPSILTAGLLPKFTRPQPPFRPDDGGGDGDGDAAAGERSFGFSSPNRASWINGLATLLGGDPHKNGGDEANCELLLLKLSNPQPPCKRENNNKKKSTNVLCRIKGVGFFKLKFYLEEEEIQRIIGCHGVKTGSKWVVFVGGGVNESETAGFRANHLVTAVGGGGKRALLKRRLVHLLPLRFFFSAWKNKIWSNK